MYNVNKKQSTNNQKQVTHLSQRDHTAGWVSYGQTWKTETGRQYFTDIIRSTFNHCGVTGQQSYRIWWKKRKLRAITLFKVIQGHRIGINRKPVCDQKKMKTGISWTNQQHCWRWVTNAGENLPVKSLQQWDGQRLGLLSNRGGSRRYG